MTSIHLNGLCCPGSNVTPVQIIENFSGLTSGNTVTISKIPLTDWPVEMELNGIPDPEATINGKVITFSTQFKASPNGQGSWLATVRYWTAKTIS